MQQLITVKQAKQITGGRTPLVPIQYEQALAALTACVSIDDAQVWSDKADALAAWAKIYHSDDAERKAKALKLHAFRRMATLAKEIRPTKTGPNGQGPMKLLEEYGMSRTKAASILAVGNAREGAFQIAVNAKNPPTPSFFRRTVGPTGGGRREYASSAARRISDFHIFSVGNDPSLAADGCKTEYTNFAALRKQVQDLIAWLDDFERCLPKDKK